MQAVIERLERAERINEALNSLRRETWGALTPTGQERLEDAQTDAAIAAEDALLALDEAGDNAA